MKATGIVRRIDDLGRVVIPKEIRRTMRIREGDPLEIFTDRDGEVIFKKYSPIGELLNFSAQYAVTTHAGFYTEYRLDCRYENGISRITIVKPESVAGICGVLDGENAVLQYEDVALDALLPQVSGYAPMDVLHVLVTQLSAVQGTAYGMETDQITVEYRSLLPNGSESLKLITLHPETLDLMTAECYLDDSLILTLHMENLNWDS